MSSSNLKQQQGNARNLLRKHLNRQYALNSPSSYIHDNSDNNQNTQLTTCSIIAKGQDTKTKNMDKVNSPFKRGYRGINSQLVTNSSIPAKTKQTIEQNKEDQNKDFQTDKKRQEKMKKREKEKKQILIRRKKEGTYVKEVKSIILDFINKLLPNRNWKSLNDSIVNKGQILSKCLSYQQHEFQMPQLSFSSQNEDDSLRNPENKLVYMQNKTNYFVEELQNIKQLWYKSNNLRKQLIRYNEDIKKQNDCYQQNITSDNKQSNLVNKTVAFNQFRELINDLNKGQINQSLKQLQVFQKNIANHLEELKDRIIRIQQMTGASNKQSQLTHIIDHLRERNRELQIDNISILEQNQKIHLKLNELQTKYKHKTNRLLNQIKQLKNYSNHPEIIQQQSESSQEILNLKQQLHCLAEQNCKYLHEMSIMQNQIETLEDQKKQLSNLVEEYEIREHQSSKANTRMVGELKEKISSLEREFGKIEQGYKITEVAIKNHSQNKAQEIEMFAQQSEMRKNVERQQCNQSLVLDNEGVFDVLKMSILEKQNQQLNQRISEFKIKLQDKQQQIFIIKSKYNIDDIQEQSKEHSISSIILSLKNHLSTSPYTFEQQSKLINFFQKIFHSEPFQDCLLQLSSTLKAPTSNIQLSSRTFELNSSNQQHQPTFMDIFSKFDQMQQCIFRLIDFIGSNLKPGDLLTNITNQFIMRAIPDKNYEEYEKMVEQFVMKIADYQNKKTKTVDKVISNYIMLTQGIFKEKEEIEAALDESSDDDEELDKCLWEDILYPQNNNKQQKVKVNSPQKRRKPILMPSIKQFVEINSGEPLPVIKEQRKHKKNVSLYSEDDSDSYYSNNTPNLTPIKRMIDEQN